MRTVIAGLVSLCLANTLHALTLEGRFEVGVGSDVVTVLGTNEFDFVEKNDACHHLPSRQFQCR